MKNKDSQISLKRRLVLSDTETAVETFAKKPKSNTSDTQSSDLFKKSKQDSLLKSKLSSQASTNLRDPLAEAIVLENSEILLPTTNDIKSKGVSEEALSEFPTKAENQPSITIKRDSENYLVTSRRREFDPQFTTQRLMKGANNGLSKETPSIRNELQLPPTGDLIMGKTIQKQFCPSATSEVGRVLATDLHSELDKECNLKKTNLAKENIQNNESLKNSVQSTQTPLVVKPVNYPTKSSKLKTNKKNSNNFSKFLLTLILISNSLICINQTYLVNSFIQIKALGNKRIESLDRKLELYKENLQKQIDDIFSKEILPLKAFPEVKNKTIHQVFSLNKNRKKANFEKTKIEKVRTKETEILALKPSSKGNQQALANKPQTESKELKEQELTDDTKNITKKDTDYSVIRPREESLEEKKQFSILTNAEYTEYQTIHKAKTDSKPKEMYSYNQLPIEPKGFYSNRETKK